MNLTKAVNSQQETVVLEAERARVPVRRSKALLFSGLRIQMLSEERVLRLSGKTIAATAQGLTRRELINRFFSIPSLKSLRINWRKGEVRLEFAARLSSIAEPLLVQGGSHMAEATIQPDYKIGPEISAKISRLAMVIRAANNGIVIAENSPLEKFLKCDSIVFDDSVAWQVPETGDQTFSRAAHAHGFAEVLFFALGSENHAANLASRLGFDSFRGRGSESKRTYIEERQKQGHSVIYVGDCDTERAAAEQADVVISVLDLSCNKQMNKFSIALLSPDLVKILQLRTIVVRAVNEFKLGSGFSLAPNLAAVFGALSLGSPTSVAVLLTNLGMLAAYTRPGSYCIRPNANT
jgi:hypothetical protein